jgi:peptide/nickel transport system permease protein
MAWAKFRRNKLAMLGAGIIVVIVVCCVFAPLLTSYDVSSQDIMAMRQAPSAEHLLGTDDLGRDVWTRLLYGGRVSIVVGLAAMGLQLVIGVTLGALAGYFGGWVDAVVMRLIDVIMCFPFFVIALAAAAVLGAGLVNIVLIIGFLQWPHIARIVRAEVLSAKRSDYVASARTLGLGAPTIIFSELLPNVASPVIVAATLSIAEAILAEASLSFLGLGVTLPEPSWGNMLVAAQNIGALQYEWWRWLPAGIAVIAMVLSINFVGDGLRDALDPKIGR